MKMEPPKWLGQYIVVMITSIDISHEIFAVGYVDSFKITLEASSQASSAMVTTTWKPGFTHCIHM